MENNLIKNAKLVDVTDKDGKINLTFLKDDKIYEVGWNKRQFDSTLNDWIESEEKEAKVEEWSDRYFGCPTKDLEKKLGTTQDVYVYDTYASLWESKNKFTKEDNKKSWKTQIESIEVDSNGIVISYKCDDKLYSSKMSFTQKMGESYFLNPIKERKQRKNFQEKYGVPVEEADSLIGQEILVKVKCAFGKYYYGEIDVL